MLSLVFRAGEQRCAIRASEVLHVAPFVSVTDGHIQWRGARLPAVDVAMAVSGGSAPLLRSTRVLVCKSVALLAPSATDTFDCTEPSPAPQGAPAFVTAVIDTTGEPAWLLDPMLLYEAVRDA